jgi:hypothetical protein
MIKIKSLIVKRYEVADESNVKRWFDNYRRVFRELNIRRCNIINFDENDFRIECSKEDRIIVSENVKQFYLISSENRKSVTIIDIINATNDYSSSSMIIIQEQEIMTSWFAFDTLSSNTHIVSSDSDFTFDKIALKFLKHYIKHSDAEFNFEWKLMLMNNHDFHTISKFISLINDNHIRSFSFISHLTHCMQSLNVDVFRL